MRKVPIPLTQRLSDLLRGPVAVAVWLGTGSAAVWLLLQRPAPVTHVAWMPPLVAEVTAPEGGRLEVLSVEPGQFVTRGEVLGRLTDAVLQARLATELARVEELRARVQAAEVTAEIDVARYVQNLELTRAEEVRRYAGDLRRYQGDEAELALDLLEHGVDRARTAAQIERIRARLRRARALVANGGVGPRADVEDLELSMQQEQAELSRQDELLARASVELEAATLRLETFLEAVPPDIQAYAPPDALAGIRAAVLVQQRAVEEVEVSLGALEITAPMDGVVQEVLRLEGQSVAAAEVVLRVVAPDASEAVLFIDPAVAHEALVGRPVELLRTSQPETVVESVVASVSPQIELLPERLWLAPDLPRYGRAVRVPIGSSSLFIPGEVLGARLR